MDIGEILSYQNHYYRLLQGVIWNHIWYKFVLQRGGTWKIKAINITHEVVWKPIWQKDKEDIVTITRSKYKHDCPYYGNSCKTRTIAMVGVWSKSPCPRDLNWEVKAMQRVEIINRREKNMGVTALKQLGVFWWEAATIFSRISSTWFENRHKHRVITLYFGVVFPSSRRVIPTLLKTQCMRVLSCNT